VAIELTEFAVAQPVRPRVANVRGDEVLTGPQQCLERGTHALDGRIDCRDLAEPAVGIPDGLKKRIARVLKLTVDCPQDVHGRRGRKVTGGGTAHAVGDGYQPGT